MAASQSVGSASRRIGRSAREGEAALQGGCSGVSFRSRVSAARRRGECGALVGPAGSVPGFISACSGPAALVSFSAPRADP